MKFIRDLGWPVAFGLLLALFLLRNQSWYLAETTRESPPPSSYAHAVQVATPAVVNIYTSKVIRERHPLLEHPFFNRFFNLKNLPQRERIQRSLGSGVIFSNRGYILTNLHVIDRANEILVLLHDGRDTLAQVVGIDPDTDLAVLQIGLEDLTPIPIGDPLNAKVGDIVLAIGNPFGFGQTVTQGIISATGRYGLNLNTYENYIQTDAAINPGNSGGALIDTNGRLLGINSAIAGTSGGSQGIGLAIPADYAAKALDDILTYGEVQRGWMGLEVQAVPLSAAVNGEERRIGLMVAGLHRNGPAELAGLQQGDIIMAINDIPIGDGRTPMYRVAMTAPGTVLSVDLIRKGESIRLMAEVGKRPAQGD